MEGDPENNSHSHQETIRIKKELESECTGDDSDDTISHEYSIVNKTNAGRLRKYGWRENNDNIPEEKKRKVETQNFTEKQNTDKLKLQNVASLKVYRDKKNIQLSQKPQIFISHRHTQVDFKLATSGTIQNISEWQGKRKSNAERQREYRQRVKNKREKKKIKTEPQNFTENLSLESQHSVSQIHIQHKNVPEKKKIKTEPQNFTENISLESQHSVSQIHIQHKNVPEKKKIKTEPQNFTENLSLESQHSVSQIHIQHKNVPEKNKIKTEPQNFTENLSPESQHSYIQFQTVPGTSGTIVNVPESSHEWYCSDTRNLDELRLKSVAYLKEDRDKPKIDFFLNIEPEIQLQESQIFISHRSIQVDFGAGTFGTIQNASDSSEQSQRQSKSNAERQREYRQRLKKIREKKGRKTDTQKFSEKPSQESSGTIQNVSDSSEQSQRRSKSNAERQREYRQRMKKIREKRKRKTETQKNTEKPSQEPQRSVSQIHIQDETVAGTSGTVQNISDLSEQLQRIKKSNAERQREYRQRLKKIREKKKIKTETPYFTGNLSQHSMSHTHIQFKTLSGTSGTIQNVPEFSQEWHCSDIRNVDEIKLRNAAYSKAYRDRKKFAKFSNIESEIKSQSVVSDRHIQVDQLSIAGTSGTIQNVPDSSDESQGDMRQTYTSPGQMGNQVDTIINKYKDYDRHVAARVQFHQQFTQNPFGYACDICDRLWFKNDLKLVKDTFQDLFRQIIQNYQDGSTVAVCSTCRVSIKKNKIPNLSKYNGFQYPDFPSHLPKLDIISERLICPRLPFMQIKRLRHYGQPGQYKLYGQIINVPVEANNMVINLPRHLDDDHSIYINIQKKLVHKSHYLRRLVNKQNIEVWLRFLVDTPLYRKYGISIDESFFNIDDTQSHNDINEVSEYIPVGETLTAQQQTLLWDEDKYLCNAPGEGNSPVNLLFDEHAEELSFPEIYLGQFRKYDITVTAFAQATSELRRADRRGATPNHILYLAMKIMGLRVRDSLTVAFKHASSVNVAKEQIMEKEFINTCLESNLAFLKSIPNSTWYWSGRKRDLFAMIRQLGKPTAFMTLSANEINWIPLLKILHKLKNSCDEISTEAIEQLHPMERCDLVNEDPVTCAIYFSKLVNVLMTILMSKRNSPFEKYYVTHYYKRIEFQHVGSPHAHILLWLNNAPNNILGKKYNEAIQMINRLSSVSASEASSNMKLNTHKHTDTCYKKITNLQYKKCRFEAPFMPCKQTLILSPMDKDNKNYSTLRKHYASIRKKLEHYSFRDFNDFYNQNAITSDQHYYDIIRAGINRPKVFLKRLPTEKWHNPFNPFIFSLLQSNMDFQLILDEYSCAKYVVDYVNKTDRGISDLQKKIIQIMDEHPEFDIAEITGKMSIEMLNTVEMSLQEAAWYLLREPMSKSSTAVIYIPTVPPHERQKIRETMEELEKLDNNESTDLWRENIFEKYEKRPEYLYDVSLAQFVSKYYKKIKTCNYAKRKYPKIIRYRNYNMTENFNEYRREMVTLHMPFKNEQEEILLNNKYVNIYEENKNVIIEKRKEFESDVDIDNTMRICRQLCEDNNDDLNHLRTG